MLRYLVDENFNQRIVRGLTRRWPEIDIVLAQDIGLASASDSAVLERAALEDRIVLTHDVRTLVPEARTRAAAGSPMPGVIASSDEISIGTAIDDSLLIHQASTDGDWEGQVLYLPL